MSAAAIRKDEFELTQEEKEKAKHFGTDLATKTVLGTVGYPMTFTKVLFQLGHEPYPVTSGRSFIFFGRETYYLPNFAQYIRNIVKDYGVITLFHGLDAAIVSTAVSGTTGFATQLYIDRYFPTLGGDPLEDKEEHEIDDHYSARLQVRAAIRRTAVQVVSTIVSRPFTVIMIRKIAQHIGGEFKYTNVFTSFLRIGNEEGPRGYFSGLLPAIIADVVTVWAVTGIRYGIERFLQRTGIDDTNDEEAKEHVKESRFLLNYIVPYIAGSFSYPFTLVSTIMAVTGSGLAVSMLPYSPLFPNWLDAYDYAKANKALTRGSKTFMRQWNADAITISNGRLYARTKHFI